MAGHPPVVAEFMIDLFYTNYSNAVWEAGGLPILLPLDMDPAEYLDVVDGLLFSGGTDIDPELYGQHAVPETVGVEARRDEFELALCRDAIANHIPTLGICRGVQLINVATGGTLRQHVPTHVGIDQPAAEPFHDVTIAADSRLATLYGSRLAVNSLHHQALDDIGAGLRVTAVGSDDQLPEAIEHESLPVTGVQWHPEMMDTRSTDPIFSWLVDAAKQFKAARN